MNSICFSFLPPTFYLHGLAWCMEKAIAPHFSTLAWKLPWMEEPGRGREGSDMTERLHFHFSLSCIGEGNGNPLQCSCLENPREGGAWWAAVYGVPQSRTRLKWLSSSSSMMYSWLKALKLYSLQEIFWTFWISHFFSCDLWKHFFIDRLL